MTAVQARSNGRAEDDRSLGELLRALTGELQHLFRAELQLAKIETKQELDQAKDVAKHGAVAAGAGVLAVLLLSFAAAWGLAEVMPAGVAFLIVGAVYAVVAIIAGLAARDRARRVDLKPTETIETLEEDAQWLKTRSK
jgi:hypothetical protein